MLLLSFGVCVAMGVVAVYECVQAGVLGVQVSEVVLLTFLCSC